MWLRVEFLPFEVCPNFILFYFFFYLFISFSPLLYAKIKDQRRIIF